jgi:hypothetical protein
MLYLVVTIGDVLLFIGFFLADSIFYMVLAV